jgi:hypothetical protein
MPVVHDADSVGEVRRVFRRNGFYVDVGDAVAEVQVRRHLLTIGSHNDGIVIDVHVRQGDKISAGSPICTITGVGAYDGIFNQGIFANAVFIAYRRADAAGYTGRIYDSMVYHLGRWHVFRDIGSLRPGHDFVRQVQRALAFTRVMIVVVGKGWLDARGKAGNRRLDDPFDLHRLEIGTALERRIPVVPVLVDGADMPPAGELPDELRPFAFRQAIRISDDHWDEDVDHLTGEVGELLEESRRTYVPGVKSGDQIYHREFGAGKVVGIEALDEDALALVVQFGMGVRTLRGSDAAQVRWTKIPRLEAP